MRVQTEDVTSPTSIRSTDWVGSSALPEEHVYRAGAYNLIASLLHAVPERKVLEPIAQLAALTEQQDDLAMAMSMLGLAARDTAPDRINDEFHFLFIGLGRGELVPYASWYLTGFLMERPLAVLRDDLAKLGYAREESMHEPEDHIAALCEVMAMMICDNQPFHAQAHFFATHLANWADRFFLDLSNAKQAVFYRAAGRFGHTFMELERTYFGLNT